MPFIELDSIPGLIWIPEEIKNKKHNCKDCFSCQMCSNERCDLCLKKSQCKNEKSKI
jgi:hypothetical protein